MSLHPISFGHAFRFAWATFRLRYGLFLVSLLTLFIAWVVLEIAVIAGQHLGLWWWIVAHLTFLFFFAGIEAGLLGIALALCEDREPTYFDVFKHLANGPIFLTGQLVYLLIVAGGLLLLVIPGLYLGARYSFFGFGLLARDASLTQSFRQSAKLSAGRSGNLFGVLVFLSIINVLGAGLLGLGLLITVPLSVLTMAALYRQLSQSARART